MTLALYIVAGLLIGAFCVWALLRELLPELGGISSPFTWLKRK